jgi:hypothetical protein
MDFIEGSGQQQQAQPQVSPEEQNQTALAQEAVAATPEMIPAGGQFQQGQMGGTGLANEMRPQDTPDEDAGEEDQKEYDDLFIRVMSAVNDIRKAPNARKSLADQTIELLSNKDKEPQEAIGVTAGLTMQNILQMAKKQKKEYQPDVIREVGMDLIGELYMIADKSGAIENLPEEDSKEYQAITHQAALEAVKVVGEGMIKGGTAKQAMHKKELDQQMQREADSGELDSWGMEEFDDETRFAIAQNLKKGGG